MEDAMYLETVLNKLIDAMVEDLRTSFPGLDTGHFQKSCQSFLITLLKGYKSRTHHFDMACSGKAIYEISQIFGQKFRTADQPDMAYHINEVRTWLLMFGMFSQEEDGFEELMLCAAAQFASYIGAYADQADIESIQNAYQDMLAEGKRLAELQGLADGLSDGEMVN